MKISLLFSVAAAVVAVVVVVDKRNSTLLSNVAGSQVDFVESNFHLQMQDLGNQTYEFA